MLNKTSCRTLLTAVALLGTTISSGTILSAKTKTDETVNTANTTETTDKVLFHKASNLLEAKLQSGNTLNPGHLSGLQNIDNQFYYFNEDGTLHTGWQKFGDNTVYYQDDGDLTKGLVTLEDKDDKEGTYYFDDNGVMVTGWKTVDGKKYYFNKDGMAQTSDMKDGDTTYTFDKKGVMTGSHKEEKKEEVAVSAENSNAGSSDASYSAGYAETSYNGTTYQAVSSGSGSTADAAPAAQPSQPAVSAPVDDGALGTISIGGYSARVYQGGADNSVNQPIVDAPNSAVLMNYMGRQMIADHAYQGFSVLRSCGAGSVGSFCGRTIVCASTYQGTNTGYGILLDDGRYADEVYDGTYIMYTCNDASGVSVTVTFWN